MSQSAFEQQMDDTSTTRQVAGPPCPQAEMSSAVAPFEACRPTGILVIEDERLLRKVMEQVLRRHRFSVWVAANGAEGIDLYRRVAAQIDVVLSDVQMPVLNGPKTLDALREINPSVRCCFMTGDTRPTRLAELMGQRPAGLFIKPFETSEVVAALKKLAGQPTGNVEVDGKSNCEDN